MDLYDVFVMLLYADGWRCGWGSFGLGGQVMETKFIETQLTEY